MAVIHWNALCWYKKMFPSYAGELQKKVVIFRLDPKIFVLNWIPRFARGMTDSQLR